MIDKIYYLNTVNIVQPCLSEILLQTNCIFCIMITVMGQKAQKVVRPGPSRGQIMITLGGGKLLGFLWVKEIGKSF